MILLDQLQYDSLNKQSNSRKPLSTYYLGIVDHMSKEDVIKYLMTVKIFFHFIHPWTLRNAEMVNTGTLLY